MLCTDNEYKEWLSKADQMYAGGGRKRRGPAIEPGWTNPFENMDDALSRAVKQLAPGYVRYVFLKSVNGTEVSIGKDLACKDTTADCSQEQVAGVQLGPRQLQVFSKVLGVPCSVAQWKHGIELVGFHEGNHNIHTVSLAQLVGFLSLSGRERGAVSKQLAAAKNPQRPRHFIYGTHGRTRSMAANPDVPLTRRAEEIEKEYAVEDDLGGDLGRRGRFYRTFNSYATDWHRKPQPAVIETSVPFEQLVEARDTMLTSAFSRGRAAAEAKSKTQDSQLVDGCLKFSDMRASDEERATALYMRKRFYVPPHFRRGQQQQQQQQPQQHHQQQQQEPVPQQDGANGTEGPADGELSVTGVAANGSSAQMSNTRGSISMLEQEDAKGTALSQTQPAKPAKASSRKPRRRVRGTGVAKFVPVYDSIVNPKELKWNNYYPYGYQPYQKRWSAKEGRQARSNGGSSNTGPPSGNGPRVVNIRERRALTGGMLARKLGWYKQPL